jgi:hypothetical protein
VKRRALLLLLPFVPGCGYALAGRGVTVDPSIKRIGVPLFRNSTGKAGLEQKITREVIEELLKRGRFDVVQTLEAVDARVDGDLVAYNVRPVGITGQEATGTTQASRYGIELVARVRYEKTGGSEPIWSSDSFSFRDEYELGSDPALFFDREEQAIERLAVSFARSLVAAMLEAF